MYGSGYRSSEGGGGALTPRTAIRVASLGVVALTLFGIVFFRLWFLQVLAGDQYLADANNNRVREVTIEAPRGEIVDRRGETLVGNRPSWAVQIEPQTRPTDLGERSALYRRLGRVLGVSSKSIQRRVNKELLELPFSSATVARDVSYTRVAKLMENQSAFPSVVVQRIFERGYPHGSLAAHMFGYVGEIDQQQLEGGRFDQAKLGDRVGKDGLELRYDQYLRGRSGSHRIQVDAVGRSKGSLASIDPKPGSQLRLTLDLDVQVAGEKALKTASRLAGSNGNAGGAGAFVAMDIRDGAILAMGSMPTFDPAIFTKNLSQATFDRLISPEGGAPYANRAVTSGYPAGSTFKLISALAGLESGIYTPSTVINDGGKIKIADRYFKNAGEQANGPVALRRALAVSSDVYFYNLGQIANGRGGDIIQKVARRLGLGQSTGIDLPGEAAGLVPTPSWRNKLKPFKFNGQMVKPEPWTVGHAANLVVGQGDLKVSPLQMAVAYATVGNGGYVVRPHLALRVEKTTGQAEQELKQVTPRKVKLNPHYRAAILGGLRAAASEPGGTSADVFSGFPIPVAGKTGTAETPQGDQSWYVALAPYPNPRYVVATTIERGGFGAESAAPAARLILGSLFHVRRNKIVEGKSRTN